MILPFEEEHTLKLICAHHGVTDPKLIKDLSELCCWIHQDEQAKHNPGQSPPVFLLVLLSQLGVLTRRPQPRRSRTRAA